MCFVGKNSHAINQLIKKTPCHISLMITQFGVINIRQII